jgi:hypothetical protein
MDTTWKGQVFIFDNENGDDLASLTFPERTHSRVITFRVSGPFQPAIANECEKIGDVTQWITELNRIGFVFVVSDCIAK